MFKEYMSKYWFLLALVAAAQILALIWMVGGRVSLLSSGREVVLETVPVDPRSLFRGDYVRLRYNISSIDGKFIASGSDFKRNDPAYVTLQIRDKKPAKLVGVGKRIPLDLKPDEIVIRGRVTSFWKGRDKKRKVRLRFGLERYYVPEGEGKRLERMVGKNNFAVLAAVAGDGEAAIKGLMIDGKLQFEEPLF